MFQVNEIGNDLDREIELLTAVHRQVLTEAGQEDIADLLDRLQSAESEVELLSSRCRWPPAWRPP